MTKLTTKRAKLPKDKRPKRNEVFDIETSEGTIQVRTLVFRFKNLREMVEDSEQTMMVNLFESHVLEDSIPTLDELDEEELMDLMEVWQEASKVDLGEYSASDN